MRLIERVDAVRERWNVLRHPFYQRWSAGELTREELSFYAGEYRHAVVELAEASERVAVLADDPELDLHAAQERSHVELWDRFAEALGADLDREPLPETVACAASWTAAADELEGLVTLYSVEAGQPAVSQTKLAGLSEHYGVTDSDPAASYFALHSTLDVEHAEHDRVLIEGRMADADSDRLVSVAEAAVKAHWRLLDGVERASL